ncbi:hypothetical protein B0T14DRAFT_567933 [Immersiella caudata]|uniref:Uncharacterized protein n=1 Tax=Immersiella caudata TaxID=314043 RepID=A0AA40BWH4_9PEZI|nr:hypothetical protein B0T14DRAFT_567933 [Immersiella caudata]
MSFTVWEDRRMFLCGLKAVYNKRGVPTPEPDAWRNAASLSVVHWDGLEGRSMSDAIEAHVDECIVRNDQYFRYPDNYPLVIRAIYDGRNNPIFTWASALLGGPVAVADRRCKALRIPRRQALELGQDGRSADKGHSTEDVFADSVFPLHNNIR